MTLGSITFDPDVYGTYARRSAAADYVELLSINHDTVVKRSALADWIGDNNWEDLHRPHFGPVGEQPPNMEPVEVAAAVLRAHLDRQHFLGGAYPFAVSQDEIAPVDRTLEHHGYLYLLGLCAAHSYGLETDASPAAAFELSVELAMKRRLGPSIALRRHWGGGGGFHGTVVAATKELGLPAALTGANVIVAYGAVDEGLDVLGHVPWGDTRAGRWTFVGQATVGKSDGWDRKLQEPSPSLWAELVTDPIDSIAFLAVPHHIDDDQWAYLLRSRKRLLADRVRLAPVVDVGDDDIEFVELTEDLDVESFQP